MTDDPKVESGGKEEGQDSDEEGLRMEMEDDDEQGEDGKPLAWNHPKRIRKLYDESKEGRKALRALKELGLKPSELPKLQGEMGRLQQYDRAYSQYLEEKKRGETDDDDDEAAREVKKNIARLKSQLKSLGVKMVEDEDESANKAQARTLEQRKQEVIGRARDRITELLEDAGVDLKGMSREDKEELMEEFDLKIGQKLKRDEEGRAAFIRGSLRPIEKYFKEIAARVNLPIKKSGMKSSGISQLPPRMSSSHSGSQTRKTQAGAPKNVREVTEDIVADLKARNAARRAEQE